ncbi:hypothetical protein B9Z65_2083 [Elsinoe australis]|uniref:Uncharacterized protein n=1 Tax=Elsinoe australis TaxID=40998 RepID=A0A2P7YN01_9PEZI|nr:hypothetical protein B9Z65_2083 [Elsinoe australis]
MAFFRLIDAGLEELNCSHHLMERSLAAAKVQPDPEDQFRDMALKAA